MGSNGHVWERLHDFGGEAIGFDCGCESRGAIAWSRDDRESRGDDGFGDRLRTLHGKCAGHGEAVRGRSNRRLCGASRLSELDMAIASEFGT